MKFKVKTIIGSENHEPTTTKYIFNLFYRSIIPITLFWMITSWQKPIAIQIMLITMLLVFVLFQFDIEKK